VHKIYDKKMLRSIFCRLGTTIVVLAISFNHPAVLVLPRITDYTVHTRYSDVDFDHSTDPWLDHEFRVNRQEMRMQSEE